MCYGRHTIKLSRFAALEESQLSDQLVRDVAPFLDPPQDHALLEAANTQLRTMERVFYLDGSVDLTASIGFLLQNARCSRLLVIPMSGQDFESQFAAYSGAIMRHRMWLNYNRGIGADEDFRIIYIRGRSDREDGLFLVRLNDHRTTPDVAHDPPRQEESSDKDEIVAPNDVVVQVAHLEFEGVYAPTFFTHHQRRASTDKRLHDIATWINIFRGHPHEQTRLPVEFMAYLDKIEDCFKQICAMPHDLEDETLDGFDRALGQIERTACLTTLYGQPAVAAAPQPEAQIPALLIEPAQSPTPVSSPGPAPTQQLRIRLRRNTSSTSTTSSSQEEQQLQPVTNTLLSTLLTVLTSAQQMLDNPDLPSRAAFSATRRAFEDVVARASDDSSVPEEVLALIGTAKAYFRLLARKVFPGSEGDPDESPEEESAAARRSNTQGGKTGRHS